MPLIFYFADCKKQILCELYRSPARKVNSTKLNFKEEAKKDLYDFTVT